MAAAGQSAVTADPSLHILSWNVAGWATCLDHIVRRHGSIENWLEKHHVDVLCLQEVKLQRPTIEKGIAARPPRPGEKKSSGTLPLTVAGFDTFWSPCREKTESGGISGFNGVATFARCGLTRKAERDPLGDQVLDAEGRCVLTFHQHCAIFNVYAPNDGPGRKRLPTKLKFFKALHRRMEEVRAKTSLPVVLVGDLNVSRRAEDVHPLRRWVDVGGMLADAEKTGVSADEEHACYVRACKQLAGCWTDIRALLSSRRAVPATTKNSVTGVQSSKFRLLATEPATGKTVQLGKPFVDEATAMGLDGHFSLDAQLVSALDGARPELLGKPQNHLTVSNLAELIEAVQAEEAPGRWTREVINVVAKRAGKVPAPPPSLRLLSQILSEQQNGGTMVDAFAELFPSAQGRYTCWDQYTNMRYSNVGARIDYTLVDRSLWERATVRTARLYTPTMDQAVDPLSAFGAAAAATAGGRWRPAAFDGSGVPEGKTEDYQLQFQLPGTGLVYTPPLYSDHIAASLLLERLPTGASLQLATDVATKRAQPHKAQRRLGAMFAAATKAVGPHSKTTTQPMDAHSGLKRANNETIDGQQTQKRQRSNNVAGQRSIRDMFGANR